MKFAPPDSFYRPKAILPKKIAGKSYYETSRRADVSQKKSLLS